jgi:hypothetical protein
MDWNGKADPYIRMSWCESNGNEITSTIQQTEARLSIFSSLIKISNFLFLFCHHDNLTSLKKCQSIEKHLTDQTYHNDESIFFYLVFF